MDSTEEEDVRVITEADVDLARHVSQNADAMTEHWARQAFNAKAILKGIEPNVGRPVDDVLAEVQVQLTQAEADLVAAQAVYDAAAEKVRDYQGYMRVLRERHPELAEGEEPSGA